MTLLLSSPLITTTSSATIMTETQHKFNHIKARSSLSSTPFIRSPLSLQHFPALLRSRPEVIQLLRRLVEPRRVRSLAYYINHYQMWKLVFFSFPLHRVQLIDPQQNKWPQCNTFISSPSPPLRWLCNQTESHLWNCDDARPMCGLRFTTRNSPSQRTSLRWGDCCLSRSCSAIDHHHHHQGMTKRSSWTRPCVSFTEKRPTPLFFFNRVE